MEQWEIPQYGGFHGKIIYKTEVLIGQFPMNGGYDGKFHLSTKVFIGQSSIKSWIFIDFPYFPSPCWHHPRVNPWPRGIPSFVAMRTKSGENFKSTRSTAGSPQFPSDMKRGWGGNIHIEYQKILYNSNAQADCTADVWSHLISYHLITSPWSAFLLMSFSCSLSGLVQ